MHRKQFRPRFISRQVSGIILILFFISSTATSQDIREVIDRLTKIETELRTMVAEENVRLQMQDAISQSAMLRGLVGKGESGILGGVYSLETGKVHYVKSSNKNLSEGVLR